jgi:hypothetical protein
MKKMRSFMATYDDDAFENGVLRDRARYRVPMHMRDGRWAAWTLPSLVVESL